MDFDYQGTLAVALTESTKLMIATQRHFQFPREFSQICSKFVSKGGLLRADSTCPPITFNCVPGLGLPHWRASPPSQTCSPEGGLCLPAVGRSWRLYLPVIGRPASSELTTESLPS